MPNVILVRAIIVDPHPIFCDALKTCLTKGGHLVLGKVSNLEEARQQVDALEPNLMILGPHLAESGLAICCSITSRTPTLKRILFTAHANDLIFQADAVYAGVNALLFPESTEEDCLETIAKVMAGHQFFSNEVLALAFQQIDLTKRERQVLELVVQEKTDQEIANTLAISRFTIRNHTQRILEKLGVHGRKEAIWRARHRGLI